MKIVLRNVFLFLAITTPLACAVTEALPSKQLGAEDRNLSGASYLDDVFNPVNVQISPRQHEQRQPHTLGEFAHKK